MLKKTRNRIAAVEREFEHAKTMRQLELEQLDSLMSELRAQMQATLDILEERPTPGPASEDLEAGDPGQTAGGNQPTDTSVKDPEPPGEAPTVVATPHPRLEAAS